MVEDAQAAPETPVAGKKKLVLIVAGVVALVGVAAGAGLALSGGDQPSAEASAAAPAPVEAIYVDLEPEFVINFRDKNDRPKYLKAELSVATKDPDVQESIARHMPAIRNSIVLLLSRQIYDDLVPNEGKEKLRAEALAAVQHVLEAQTGEPGVDDLYFANFVMH